jgi:hypothetical protein
MQDNERQGYMEIKTEKIELESGIKEFIADVKKDTTLKEQDVINFLLNEGYNSYFFSNTYEDLLNDYLATWKR